MPSLFMMKLAGFTSVPRNGVVTPILEQNVDLLTSKGTRLDPNLGARFKLEECIYFWHTNLSSLS